MKLFVGSAHPQLGREIAQYLGTPLGDLSISRFSDGEIYVRIQESVRGSDVFILQPTSPPVHDHLMELLIILDAFKRASARSITAVIPYYGYARQDRKVQGREAITAKLIANLLETAGATRVLTMDLHSGQLQGFFDILVDHLFSIPILAGYLQKKDFKNPIIISPDVGGVVRARHYAKRLNCPLAIIDKRRPEPNKAEVNHIIGEVEGKTAIIVDDMVDTAGTLVQAAKHLLEKGATDVYAVCVHPVLSGSALDRISESSLKELVVTNTIPLKSTLGGKITALSVAPLLGEAIARIEQGTSVSVLFEE